MSLELKSKVRGMFLGIAVGDAMGSVFEGRTRDDILEITEGKFPDGIIKFYDGGEISQKTSWTDDTQLTLAVAEGIINCNNLSKVNNFMDAQVKAFIKSHREIGQRGWGGTTKTAVENLLKGKSWQNSAPTGKRDGFGNGVAMKISPLAVANVATNDNCFLSYALDLTTMTHFRSIAASSALAMFAAFRYCLRNDPSSFYISDFVASIVGSSAYGYRNNLESLTDNLPKRLCELIEWKNFNEERIIKEYRGGCYCYESIPFSLMYFILNPFHLGSMYSCIAAGGDADSNGSMVGGLIGALQGEDIFSDHLKKHLDKKDMVLDVADRLCKRLKIK